MSELLTAASFQRIKRMILARGDRQTYCNKYNQNPHVEVSGFHAYLSPDVGQRNINCDPALSDFDQLTIQDWRGGPDTYSSARVVGDTLEYDRSRAAALEQYFTALLALAE
jgi:hypothetical protein